MHKFLDKAKAKASLSTKSSLPPPSAHSAQHPQPAILLAPPTSLDILRYRTHHGTNLGSIFVLEKWLFPSMFEPTAKGDSELDAVTAYAVPLHVCLPATD